MLERGGKHLGEPPTHNAGPDMLAEELVGRLPHGVRVDLERPLECLLERSALRGAFVA